MSTSSLRETNVSVAESSHTDQAPAGPQIPHPEASRAPWSCKCGRRWRSLTQAHCTVCHEHFGTYGLADKHQTFGPNREMTCHPPAEVVTKETQKRVFRLSEEADGPVWRTYERREMDENT